MTWMLTAHGEVFDLQFIRLASIDVRTIAHHLAQINRFTGACSRPYSVAEHSLFVVEILVGLGVRSPHVLMAGLMHDAHEAYTTDLSQPMKQAVGEAWHAVENHVQHAVLARFGLLTAWATAKTVIHEADMVALVTERRQLLPPHGPTWPAEATYQPTDWHFADRAAFTWDDWRQAFLERFAELQFARGNEAAAAIQ
jgi:uncharacterized protein